MIRKYHDAVMDGDSVQLWGTGSPRREFLHVDDLADACVFLMRNYSEATHINVGTGEDLTIRGLAELVREIVHPESEIVFDATKPDGTPRKLLDVSRLHEVGWRHRTGLRDGIISSYEWFLRNYSGSAKDRHVSGAA
jgi:GDP-L-fucose synthase